jgi:hypothetical protein
MATSKNTITHSEERRTYVQGRFLGKYYGIYDDLKTEHPHERYHNIKIYEGLLLIEDPLQIRKHPAGPFPDFDAEDMYPGKLPNPLPCKVNLGQGLEPYHLNIWEPVLKKGSVKVIHSQEEGNESFGIVEAELSGYIKDLITREEVIEQEDPAIPAGTANIKTDIPTGRTETKGAYHRSEYYYTNNKDAYWGDWKYTRAKITSEGCFSVFGILVGLGLLILFIAAIGVKGFGLILLILLVILGIGLFERVARFLAGIIGLLFLIGFITSITSVSKQKKRTQTITIPKDDNRETSDTIRRKSSGDTVSGFISHHRIWEDYGGTVYEGDLIMPVNFLMRSALNRLNSGTGFNNSNTYDNILHQLVASDDTLLGTVYSMFDSIGKSNNLDRQSFAEMAVSCIQDIPYTLILDKECNAALYNDQFISRYLNEGKLCEGNIKYGLFAPAEFMGNLKGDCDTRTILLFDLLSHFGYDIAILSSEVYNHSIIAISLPYQGIYKQLNGDKFYAWETTSKGFSPGVIPAEFDNMMNWRVSLIHYSSK